MAVPVEVEETRACTPARLIIPKPGLLGHVREGSIPVVAEQTILPKIGAKDIFETVVVVVTHANPRRPTHLPQTGFVGNIGKSAVAVVPVESIGGFRRIARQQRAGQKE